MSRRMSPTKINQWFRSNISSPFQTLNINHWPSSHNSRVGLSQTDLLIVVTNVLSVRWFGTRPRRQCRSEGWVSSHRKRQLHVSENGDHSQVGAARAHRQAVGPSGGQLPTGFGPQSWCTQICRSIVCSIVHYYLDFRLNSNRRKKLKAKSLAKTRTRFRTCCSPLSRSINTITSKTWRKSLDSRSWVSIEGLILCSNCLFVNYSHIWKKSWKRFVTTTPRIPTRICGNWSLSSDITSKATPNETLKLEILYLAIILHNYRKYKTYSSVKYSWISISIRDELTLKLETLLSLRAGDAIHLKDTQTIGVSF